MSPLANRRTVIAGLAALSLTASDLRASAAPRPRGADDSGTAAVERLWAERARHCRTCLDLGRELDVAVARVAWWAAPGCKFLLADGSTTGPVSSSPAIVDLAPPLHPNGMLILRPSCEDVEQLCRIASAFGRDPSPLRREFEERLAAQEAEERRAGQLDADARLSAAFDDLAAVNRAIEALPPLSPAVTAAQHFIHYIYLAEVGEVPHECPEMAATGRNLMALLPYVNGRLARDIATLMARAGEVFRDEDLFAGADP